jgi:hypothetical protein
MLAGSRPTLIEGGFGNRTSGRRARRRKAAARVAAPLLVPLALALTLGVMFAVSTGAQPNSHVTQTTSTAGKP